MEDQFDAAERKLTRLAADRIEFYTDQTELELGFLGDEKARIEASAAVAIERVRKSVIYATHVQRYAGGIDQQATGFGLGASTYYGKGDNLTGVDELDTFRLENPHGYAQVSSPSTATDQHG